MCWKRQFDQTILSFEIVHGDLEDEKSRKGRRREDQFSVIGADFTFGLSRSRFQSPTTVIACHSRNSLSRPNAAQGSTKTNFQEQMGGSPKFPSQHLAGETSLLGDYQSPTAVARVSIDNVM